MIIDEQSIQHYLREHEIVLNHHGKRKPLAALTPFFYDSKLENELGTVVESIVRLHEFVAKNYEVFRDFLGYSSELDNLLVDSPTFNTNIPIARADIFLTNEGAKVVEVNCQTPGGNEDSFALEQLFERNFQLEEGEHSCGDRIQAALEVILNSYIEQSRFKGIEIKENPRIVLIEQRKDIEILLGRFSVFLNRARELGFDCDLYPAEEISFTSSKMIAGGKPVDIAYVRIITDSLDSAQDIGRFDFARRLNDSETAIVLPISAKKADSKKTLVLFSDPRYKKLFPEYLHRDLDLISGYIPKTLDLSRPDHYSDLPRRLLSQKNQWVIKKANSATSEGVYLGSGVDKEHWRKIVEVAINGDWIAQERLELPQIPVRYHNPKTSSTHIADLVYNVCPYSFGGRFNGFYVRASVDDLTSAKTGSDYTILPCFKREN
ncbi:MAG: hypothetical protein ABIG93_02595 [archaeon]|nr:hypothetical protein [Nanoarchaeota archaeon]